MILPTLRAGSWHRQGKERCFHRPPRKIIPRSCQKHHFSGEEEVVPKGFVINSLQLSRKLSTCKMSRSGEGFTSLTMRLMQAGARRHAASKRLAREAVQGVAGGGKRSCPPPCFTPLLSQLLGNARTCRAKASPPPQGQVDFWTMCRQPACCGNQA